MILSISSYRVRTEQKVQHLQKKVKISRRQAIAIALKNHKGANVVEVKLVKNLYFIHLKSAKGKRLLEVGANTGRLLKDKSEAGK